MKIFNFGEDYYYRAADVDRAIDKLKNWSDTAWKRGFNLGRSSSESKIAQLRMVNATSAEEFSLHESRMTEAMVSLEDQLSKSQQDVLLLRQWRDKVFDKHPNIDLDIE